MKKKAHLSELQVIYNVDGGSRLLFRRDLFLRNIVLITNDQTLK